MTTWIIASGLADPPLYPGLQENLVVATDFMEEIMWETNHNGHSSCDFENLFTRKFYRQSLSNLFAEALSIDSFLTRLTPRHFSRIKVVS